MARGSQEGEGQLRVQFCTLADARYFPGLVAMVNSLRLLGHEEPITVLDLGLTGDQRGALARECTFKAPPEGTRRHPWLLEPLSCVDASAEVVVYLDADVIVAHPLDELIELAKAGHVVAFPDERVDRWFAEWQEVFALPRPVRCQPYVNAGFLMVSREHFPQLLAEWARCCDRIVGSENVRDDPSAITSPVGLSSQDALNALLMSAVPRAGLALQPKAAAVDKRHMRQVDVVDAQTLECSFEGRRPTLLHYWGIRKPWEDSARSWTANAYSHLLRRLLTGDDIAVVIDPREVPVWLRPGIVGTTAFGALEHLLPAARSLVNRLRRSS